MPQNEDFCSLKTVIAFQSGDTLEQVWVNDKPHKLGEHDSLQFGDWLIVEDGAVYIAVYPLEPSCLGRKAPILLERGPLSELWLSIYNYRGPPKRFCDYASLHGAFWRGNMRAGFIVEVAERKEYSSVKAFLTHLTQATITDTVDDKNIRTVIYRSDGDELVLSYDLWNTKSVERQLNGVVFKPPNLNSPLAVQSDSGELRVGQATLNTDKQQVWLIAQELDPEERVWVAVNPMPRSTPMRLETPRGVISIKEWSMGRLEWRAPIGGREILISDGLKKPVELKVPDGVEVRYRNIVY